MKKYYWIFTKKLKPVPDKVVGFLEQLINIVCVKVFQWKKIWPAPTDS